jgi:hypothetical protein
MGHTLLSVLLCLGAVGLPGVAVSAAPAEESVAAVDPAPPEPASAFSFSWDVTTASRYLFQGQDYSDGHPVVQPELVFGYKSLTATIWGNQDLREGQVNEYDASVEGAIDAGPYSLSAAYAQLRYPNRVDDPEPTQEFCFSVARKASLNPSLEVHYDFDQGRGIYSTLRLNQPFKVARLPLSLGLVLFRQDHYYAMTGFPSAAAEAGMSFDLGKFTIAGTLSRYAAWENGDFRGPAAVPDCWLFSLNIAESF